MVDLWLQYIPILMLVSASLFLIVILFLVSLFLGSGTNSLDFEKFSVYECGFEPFSDTQGTFDVKFYLLAMLFMISDLEIMFSLPWAVSLTVVSFTSVVVAMWFTLVLTLAFIFEWLKGALEWQ